MFSSSGDSNTSSSPYPFRSLPSSRRSSEISSNRFSITNSPHDYETTESRPMIHSRRTCARDPSTNMSNMEAQFFLNSSSPNGLRIPRSKWIAQFLASRQEIVSASARQSNTSMTCNTPLPHEIPYRDVRRASDPVTAMDENTSPLKQLLNMVDLLPVPQNMRLLRHKSCSSDTPNPSLNSIDTDQVLLEYDSPVMDKDTEAALVEKMLEDNEDMIKPDDMRRFMNELNGDGHSMYSYDPSEPTNDGCFMAMNSHGQGKMGSNLALTDGQMNLQDILRETRAARVDGQHMQSRNLPQQSSCQQAQSSRKGVIPTSRAGSSNGNNVQRQIKAKDSYMNPGSHDILDMVNVPVNIGMQNVNAPQMMQSPVSSDNQVPCPPRTPTSGQNMPTPSLYLKNLNQIQMNQTQDKRELMFNQMLQGKLRILHQTSRNQTLAKQQQQYQEQMMSHHNPNALMNMQQQEMFGCYGPMNLQQYQQQHQLKMMHNNPNALMNMQQQEMFGCYGPINPRQYQQQYQQQQARFY